LRRKVVLWDNLYLPDASLSFVENTGKSATDKIRTLIGRPAGRGSQNSPTYLLHPATVPVTAKK
jgi:hypothetical protein